MPHLSPAQIATLKAHILANTNAIPAGFPWSGSFAGTAINAIPITSADGNAAVAGWYNLFAAANDNQPFADSLNLWKPSVTITELNTAINWAQNPAGATAADQTNAWLRWQSMCWSNSLDLTDNQVRSGVQSVWATGSSNASIKAVGTGRRAATNFERLYAGANRGPNGAAADGDMLLNGRVSVFFGQKVTLDDIQTARES